MTERYVSASFVAALLHAVAVALIVFLSLRSRPESPAVPIIQLVLDGVARESLDPPASITMPRIHAPVASPPEPLREPPPPSPSRPGARSPSTQTHSLKAAPNPPRVTPRPALPRISQSWQFEQPGSGPVRTPAVAPPREQAELATKQELYFAELRRRLRAALVVPRGLSSNLVATIEVFLAADGTLSRPVLIGPSGNAEFDRAVLQAVARTRMTARPDGRSETLEIPFSTWLGE